MSVSSGAAGREDEDIFKAVVDAEKSYLDPTSDKERLWIGIGLSGGGIRSATFALGAMQALARRDLLHCVDYISSVSGGGYLATALQWFWGPGGITLRSNGAPAAPFGTDKANFPYGTDQVGLPREDSEEQLANLSFLRNHGNYLAPGGGINLFSAATVVVRTVTISLLIWLPLLVLFFLIVHGLDEYFLTPKFKELNAFSPFGSFLPGTWDAAAIEKCREKAACTMLLRPIYASLLYLVILAVAAFAVISIVFGLLSRTAQDTLKKRGSKLVAFLVAAIAVGLSIWLVWQFELGLDASVFVAVCTLFGFVFLIRLASLMSASVSLNASYLLRRQLEVIMGSAMVLVVVVLVLGLLPVAPHYIALKMEGSQSGSAAGGFVAVVTLVGGVFSGLYGYYTFVKNISPSLAGRIFAPLGAAIYLFGTVSLAYVAAIILRYPESYFASSDTASLVVMIAVLSIVMAFCVGLIASINHVGLHRFYRDRLMEAFMPSEKAIHAGRADYSPIADAFSITDVLVRAPNSAPAKQPGRPYPIINANVILVDDKCSKVAARGGDNFILSPMFIGCAATGWVETPQYIDRHGPLSIASAMAVSGAAANANAGYVGAGVTRDRLVSSAMSLLNMGLGLWVGNPGQKSYWLNSVPTYFRPGLTSGIFGAGYERSSPFLELSDGGHFENLGLYELVRRKLDVIIIVDGEADSKISLAGLVSATNRIREDFNCTITFDPKRGPERFVVHDSQGYPSGVRYANAPFLVADLDYGAGKRGTLVYIKATMIQDLNFTTSGYWAANSDFPHQTTADQFFDPDQFEAYRDLGFKSADRMINALDLTNTMALRDGVMAKYEMIP